MKIKNLIIYCFVFLYFYSFNLGSSVFAQTDGLTQSGTSSVSAQVGNQLLYINLSGYISPFASIDLLINNYPLRNVVADQYGNFSFTAVQVQSGVTQVCFDAHDYERIGESYSCISVTPIIGNITINNLFLPPTMALKSAQINTGQQEVIQGYSMPYASILIHLSNNKTYSTNANKTGYYSYTFNDLIAGSYQAYVTATLNSVNSIKPLKFLSFNVLSLPQTITNTATASFYQVLNDVMQPFVSSPIGTLWAGVPLLIIISFLLRSAYPSLLAKLLSPFAFTFIKKKDKRLHHFWFVGY